MCIYNGGTNMTGLLDILSTKAYIVTAQGFCGHINANVTIIHKVIPNLNVITSSSSSTEDCLWRIRCTFFVCACFLVFIIIICIFIALITRAVRCSIYLRCNLVVATCSPTIVVNVVQSICGVRSRDEAATRFNINTSLLCCGRACPIHKGL